VSISAAHDERFEHISCVQNAAIEVLDGQLGRPRWTQANKHLKQGSCSVGAASTSCDFDRTRELIENNQSIGIYLTDRSSQPVAHM
jgi:hypothetical protein